VYPSLPCIQSLDLALGEVTKGNGRVNKRRRFETAVAGIHAGGRSGRSGGKKIDALKCAVFVGS